MTIIKHNPKHTLPAVPPAGDEDRHLAGRISELVLHHGLPDIRTSERLGPEALDAARSLVNVIEDLHHDLEGHERSCDAADSLSEVLDLEQQRWRLTVAAQERMGEALARLRASGVRMKVVVDGVGNTPVVGPSFGLRWRTTRA